MDLPDIKKSLLNTRKAFTQPQSDPKKSKDIEIHASVSSLASKLSKAKSSIDISKLSQQNLSLHKEYSLQMQKQIMMRLPQQSGNLNIYPNQNLRR